MDQDGDDNGEMRCELVLCLEGGPAYEVKWCPLPSNDLVCFRIIFFQHALTYLA